MTDRELMQQVMENICGAKLCEINSMSSHREMFRLLDEAIDALRERLAQPEDWQYVQKLNSFSYPRPWVGLTDEEVKDFQVNKFVGPNLIRAIEWRLKEKNA